jgi:DNA-binding NarL/FixJ family response regulator
MNIEAPMESVCETTTRIAIVDDRDLARNGLRDMLADEPSIEVVGEATNGPEAIALCSRLHLDLVLTDAQMDGFVATRELKQEYPDINVLVVTLHEDPHYLFEALKAGAEGYILKDAPPSEIVAAIHHIRSGEVSLDSRLAAQLLQRLAAEEEERQEFSQERQSSKEPYTRVLTPREVEVLELLKLGWTNRQIAEDLMISARTVKNHVEHIIGKLGVSDRTQAVVRGLQLELLHLSD